MAQLAKIETAKLPATAIAGVKVQAESNVIPLKTEDVVYQRLGLIVLVLIFGVFAVWAAFAPLGTYAVASGKVAEQTKNQVVQHREGGVIDEIFVDDGDHVSKGQKLLTISSADTLAESGIDQEQLLSNLALEARLNAELEDYKEIAFPPELTGSQNKRAKEVMAQELQQFKVRKRASDSGDAVLKQKIQQLKEQFQGADGQINAQRELGASYAKEVKELQGLFDRKLISKLQLDDTERKLLTVNSDVAALEANKASFKVQIAAAEEQLVLQNNNERKEISAQLSDTRGKVADGRNRLKAVSDRLARTVVTAPMTGTVIALAYHTQGGVVQPGGKILEIVPETHAFEVEAQINLSDIDKVRVGLGANIHFPAFPAVSFLAATPGEVVYVSADTQAADDAHGTQYYRAKIRIKPEGVAELEKRHLELVQGMPAEVSINAGERTFLDYLLKPVTSMVNHAFNED
jgi:epimerase transport system membrane fusion protein